MSSPPPPAEPAALESPAGAPSPGASEIALAPPPPMANMFGSDDDNTAANSNDMTAPGSEAQQGGDEVEGDYVPATESSAARIPSFKKRRGSGEDEGEDDEERERRKKKKQDARAERRARAAAEEEEDQGEEEPQLDEATRRRIALEERIDSVGKTNRAPRRKKKGDDIDIVEGYHDDVCVRLRDRMYTAAEADQKANMKKMPATSKLAMLDEVVSALQNTTLWSSIIDNEVLKAVKMWLEPLPDKSLPAVGIQKAVFEVLPKMDLDTATIREAGLGPIVLFYTKTKRVTPPINRAAEALVQTWSRPIIKRPADFRSRYIQTADEIERTEYDEYDDDGEPRERQPRPKTKTKNQRFNVAEALTENRDRKGARLPSVRDVQYTVAPESRLTHRSGETGYIARIQQDNKKFNRFARQLKGQKSGR
ncbi:hypothetical protein CspeluHIS016_0902260 [Cutaneotrichosporon spelunceum]|uniref:TFIIS N-terminal domain-containing protein n=1 Tax=Cutaneotrichosporon spelunceum TaxID=1672016 RepID=A0AAD3YFE3_9TREE|nr:hypothetical protein CspeluHIS016_0902260 [Cutaneotrichosporon spelunceum]